MKNVFFDSITYVHMLIQRTEDFAPQDLITTRMKAVLRNPFTRETKNTRNTIIMRDCNYNHRLQIDSQSYNN